MKIFKVIFLCVCMFHSGKGCAQVQRDVITDLEKLGLYSIKNDLYASDLEKDASKFLRNTSDFVRYATTPLLSVSDLEKSVSKFRRDTSDFVKSATIPLLSVSDLERSASKF